MLWKFHCFRLCTCALHCLRKWRECSSAAYISNSVLRVFFHFNTKKTFTLSTCLLNKYAILQDITAFVLCVMLHIRTFRCMRARVCACACVFVFVFRRQKMLHVCSIKLFEDQLTSSLKDESHCCLLAPLL